MGRRRGPRVPEMRSCRGREAGIDKELFPAEELARLKTLPESLKRWLPAAAWGGLILFASTGIASGQRTADFLQCLFAWFHFGSGHHHAHLGEVNFFARKSAHVLQFVLYALLVWHGLRRAPAVETRPLRVFFWAVGSATVLAFASEGIQLFFPMRSPLFSDVVLDVCGAVLGILCALALHAIANPTRAAAAVAPETGPSAK